VGRGLTSLRTRAQRLGGTLTVEPADPGTAVTLRFPL
jgi:signal transduction histidine kinase